MHARNRFTTLWIALFFAVIGAAVLAPGLSAQDQGWMVVRADYGYKNQRNDVTGLLQDLIARGGVNGRVSVNNQTMGGDPAQGADKTLRIFARNRRGEEHEFDYKEGGSVDVTMFAAPGPPNDWGDRGYGRDGDVRNGLQIIRAYYGVQRQQANVTDLVRSMVRGPGLQVSVDNRTLGGDPAPGADKTLIIIYRFQGNEAAVAAGEGKIVSIP
ncbi:MAG TPA: hypothetical protein VMM16_08695 [Verrucomicrobiae bacterium]|nr:hypothetical protein [Verrucomicrobiae bacterium]